MSRLRPVRRSMAAQAPAPAPAPSLVWHASLADHVIDLQPSADGELVAVATVEGAIRLLDAGRGELRHALAGHPGGMGAIDWSPSAPVLASGGHDGSVRLWEGPSGRELACLDVGRAWIERVRWSPDGRHLAVACGRRVMLCDAQGQPVRELAEHESTVSDIAWSPTEGTLAAACYGGVTLWSADDGSATRLEWPGSCLGLAWSPDGRMLATGHQDATVHFWRVDRGADLEMSGYATKVRELAWDPGSRHLATGGGPEVTVWDCREPGPAHTRPARVTLDGARVSALAAQAHGPLMAAATEHGGLAVFAPPGAARGAGFSLNEEVSALAWHPDGGRLLAGTAEGAVACLAIA